MFIGMASTGKMVLRAQMVKIGLTRTKIMTTMPNRAKLRVFIMFKDYIG
jgi:hypothetical protein